MTTASERLAALGLELPPVPAPVAAYIPAIRVGDQIWTSGQLPTRDGKVLETGIVGRQVSPEVATDMARLAALNALAAAAEVAGGLDKIRRVVKVVVYVASDPAFVAQPQVANGASKLLGEVIGSAHVRSAVGVAVLPLNAPVEVEIVVEAVAEPFSA
jgi:enamine deaminase RidA (YjgF/YER057c/UK114 family)